MDAIYCLGHRVGVGRWVGQGGEAAPDRPRISRAAYLRSRHGAAGRSSAPEHFCPWALGAMGVGSNWVPGAQGGALSSGGPRTCTTASLGAPASVTKSWWPSGDLFFWALGVGWCLGVGRWVPWALGGPGRRAMVRRPPNSVYSLAMASRPCRAPGIPVRDGSILGVGSC